MEKYNSVDDFLIAIVLNFDSNEITDKIISKIGLIRSDDKRSKLEIVNNTILYEFYGKESGTKEIKVDAVNKKILVEETGVKEIDGGMRNYANKYNYSVAGDKSINYSLEKNYDIKKQSNGYTLLNEEILEKYKYYDHNNYIGSSEEKKEQTIIKDKDNNTLNDEENNIQKVKYVLPTEDIIEIKTINGQTSYYFSSKYSDRKDSFSKKITKNDVDRILSLGDNAYSVLNDETVYGVRGSAYN